MNQLFKYCSVGVFLLMSNSVFSQKHKVLNLPTDSTTKDTRTTNISFIEVRSAMMDSLFIGVSPSEEPNTRDILEAPYGIQGWLQSFVDREYSSTYSPSGIKLLWSIDALSAGIDSSDGGKVSFVKLGAEVFSSESKDSYQKLGRFDTVMVSKGTEIKLGQEMVTAVNSLFSNSIVLAASSTIEKLKNVSTALKIANKDDLDSRSFIDNQTVSWKILKDSIYPRGVFMSFQEFQDNAPSVANFLAKVDTAAEKINIYQFMPDSSSKVLNNVWGVSINNELYRYSDGNLYPIEKSGTGFALSKYLDFNKRKNQGFYWRKSIGSMFTDSNPFNDSHIYRVQISREIPFMVESTKIDVATGDLTF